MSDEKAISETYTPGYTPGGVESDMAFSLSGIQNYRIINNTIYFRIKIPHRIRRWFVSPDSPRVSCEILRSLHTKVRLVDNDPSKTPIPKSVRDKIDKLRSEFTSTFDILERNGVPDEIKLSLARGVFPSKEAPVAAPAKKDILTFRKVADDYLDNITNNQKWRVKSVKDVRYAFEIFEKMFGDLPIEEIDIVTARTFSSQLRKLPPNMTKTPCYRDKSIAEILAMDNVEPMADRSINKNIKWLRSLFDYAVRNEFATKNPFTNKDFLVKIDTLPEEERRPYTKEELQVLVDSIRWNPQYPNRFWVTMIGLHHGVRANQICQLDCKDIIVKDGIPCFCFRPEKKRSKEKTDEVVPKHLKSKASRKVTPIHPFLIRLGFLEYVEFVKNKKQRKIFYELVPKSELYSHDFTKWYGRSFNDLYIFPNGKKAQVVEGADSQDGEDMDKATFHSFRHNICDFLKQKLVPGPLISAIVGHVNDDAVIIDTSQTMTRYGKEYRPPILLDVLKKVDWQRDLNMTNVLNEAQRCLTDIKSKAEVAPEHIPGKWIPGKRLLDTNFEDAPEQEFEEEGT